MSLSRRQQLAGFFCCLRLDAPLFGAGNKHGGVERLKLRLDSLFQCGDGQLHPLSANHSSTAFYARATSRTNRKRNRRFSLPGVLNPGFGT